MPLKEGCFSGLRESVCALQSHEDSSFARHVCLYFFRVMGGLRCCRRSGGRRSWRACCSLVRCQRVRMVEEMNALTLELRLPEWRRVASDDDELGLAGAQSLECGLVAESDLAGLEDCQFCVPNTPHRRYRTLIVNASLALMLSEVLLLFFGAIVSVCWLAVVGSV